MSIEMFGEVINESYPRSIGLRMYREYLIDVGDSETAWVVEWILRNNLVPQELDSFHSKGNTSRRFVRSGYAWNSTEKTSGLRRRSDIHISFF